MTRIRRAIAGLCALISAASVGLRTADADMAHFDATASMRVFYTIDNSTNRIVLGTAILANAENPTNTMATGDGVATATSALPRALIAVFFGEIVGNATASTAGSALASAVSSGDGTWALTNNFAEAHNYTFIAEISTTINTSAVGNAFANGSFTYAFGGQSGTLDKTGVGTITFTRNVAAGQTTSVGYRGFLRGTAGVNVVPEPSSLALGGLGLAVVASMARRRRTSA